MDDMTPNLAAAIEYAYRGWCAYCFDCDQWSGPLRSLSEAEVWPTLHRVMSPTCSAPR